MVREIIASGKTVEEAIEKGAAELNVSADKVKSEVIEEPKKGLFGIGATNAKVKVLYEETTADLAYNFVKKLLVGLKIEADVQVKTYTDEEDGKSVISLSISGESDDVGIMIGRHGDTLDSIQFLTSIAANKNSEVYERVLVDVNDYRAKREEALKELARRISERVLRTKRSMTLEPMPSNERRIIHSEVQKINGVVTYSVGQDDDRKIVIAIPNANKRSYDKKKSNKDEE